MCRNLFMLNALLGQSSQVFGTASDKPVPLGTPSIGTSRDPWLASTKIINDQVVRGFSLAHKCNYVIDMI